VRFRRQRHREQEIAVRHGTRVERPAIAGGHVVPAPILGQVLRLIEVQQVDERIALAQVDVAGLGALVAHGQAHPPRRARETDIGLLG
jgi:hypothetical protein